MKITSDKNIPYFRIEVAFEPIKDSGSPARRPLTAPVMMTRSAIAMDTI